jgi:hypothetical protein
MRWEGTSGRGRMRVTRLESYRGGQGRENKYALFPVDIVGEGEKHKEEKPSNFENEKLNKPTTTILPQSSSDLHVSSTTTLIKHSYGRKPPLQNATEIKLSVFSLRSCRLFSPSTRTPASRRAYSFSLQSPQPPARLVLHRQLPDRPRKARFVHLQRHPQLPLDLHW